MHAKSSCPCIIIVVFTSCVVVVVDEADCLFYTVRIVEINYGNSDRQRRAITNCQEGRVLGCLFQSYKNIYLTGFNQCTIAQIRIKLTVDEMT